MQGRDTATVIGIVVLVVLLLGLLSGGMMMFPGMMGYGGFGFGSLWGIVMMVLWLLVIGGVVALVIWLFQQGRFFETTPASGARSALDILRERYAKGEITREQFEQMRRDLE